MGIGYDIMCKIGILERERERVEVKLEVHQELRRRRIIKKVIKEAET